jgi:hypothetical protein
MFISIKWTLVTRCPPLLLSSCWMLFGLFKIHIWIMTLPINIICYSTYDM